MAGRLKAQAAKALGLPGDVVFGDVLIHFTGNRTAYIENYRCILFYGEDRIRVQTKTCRVEIRGLELQIVYYTGEAMKITGKICGMEFMAP